MIRTCPEWKESWDYHFNNKPDKPVILTSIISGFFGEQLSSRSRQLSSLLD